MKTTTASITTAQIRTLRTEALDAGDSRMAEWCDVALGETRAGADKRKALGTRAEARQVCVNAINDAAAND